MRARLAHAAFLAALLALAVTGNASPVTRVVGGTPIDVRSSPWTVFIRYQDSPTVVYRCTGSIIDARHVVTAAHCLYDDDGALAKPSQLLVEAGLSNFATPAPTDRTQRRAVRSFRIHPDHTPGQAHDDVAVLALAAPLDLSGPFVKAVTLPRPGTPYPAHAVVSIAGFGNERASVEATGPLASMTATVDRQGDCDGYETSLIGEDNGVLFCIESKASSICSGDSGAGVVAVGSSPVLVGVVVASLFGCPRGGPAAVDEVTAPEILRFIRGDANPPRAPRVTRATTYRLSAADPVVVGSTLRCSSGGWGNGVQISYSFVDAVSGQHLQADAGPTFRIPATALGKTVACVVAATNAGGTTVVETEPSGVVSTAPS